MNPLISICVPAYNNEAYIVDTIDSVLSQVYTNFELIIVDDCSTDDTWEILQQIKDPRISIYRNEKNLGMHGNWSKALSFAKGDYIKLLCGDDLIYPDCLEKQVKVLEDPANADVVMVACKRKIISPKGEISIGSFYKLRPGKYSGKTAMRHCALFGTNLIGEPMAVLFRANIFKQNQIVLGSNNYLIDLDMYAKILRFGKLVVMPDLLAAFRVYATSMSGSLGFKHAKMFKEFIHQADFKKDFGLSSVHLKLGTFITYSLTLARNIVFKMMG
jgi:glycosyltransferase involved in cell wall biosynthesis